MIIGLLGNMGRGKTLSMTFMLYWLGSNTHIDRRVTNYQTDITTDYVATPKQLDEKTQELKAEKVDALYAIDEIWAWADSREAMDNDLMSEIILNSRKRGAVVLYTTQSADQVDKRLRKNTDFFGICQHYGATEAVHEYDHDIVKVQLFWKHESGAWIPVNEIVVNAEEYYNTYDTREEIAGMTEKEEYEEALEELEEKVRSGAVNGKGEAEGFLTGEHGVGVMKAQRLVNSLWVDMREEGVVD